MSLHEHDELMRDAELSQLFAEYRESLPDPDASPEFMPRLWEQIEARQASTRTLERWARALVTAAAAASLLMGVFLARTQQVSPFYTGTYLELLASTEHEQDSAGDFELVRVEHAAYESTR